MVPDTLRWFLLIFSLAGVLTACENEAEEEYVKTRKGDTVRSRDAKGSNIPSQPDPKWTKTDGETVNANSVEINYWLP